MRPGPVIHLGQVGEEKELKQEHILYITYETSTFIQLLVHCYAYKGKDYLAATKDRSILFVV